MPVPRTAAVSAVVAAALAAGLVSAASSQAAPATPVQAKIHDIQGTTRISPLAGQQVTGVTGVVTGVRAYGSSKGFWFQDTAPDKNPATSEGVFVFTGSSPTVAVGDAVEVAATVTEYVPGGALLGQPVGHRALQAGRQGPLLGQRGARAGRHHRPLGARPLHAERRPGGRAAASTA